MICNTEELLQLIDNSDDVYICACLEYERFATIKITHDIAIKIANDFSQAECEIDGASLIIGFDK